MIKYSIIIPTHNRHNLMKKNIEYFSKFKNCQIYICDSSLNKSDESFPSNIIYYHLKNKTFAQKMTFALKKIDTEYTAVCADDDFLIENTIQNLCIKMKKNSCVMGVGKYFGFNIPFFNFFQIYINRNHPYVLSNNKYQRIDNYMQDYYMSLWGVYQTNILKDTYNILSTITLNNDNFIELFIAFHFSCKGKIFFSNDILGVREINNIFNKNHWGNRHLTITTENIQDTKIQQDIQNIVIALDNTYFMEAIKIYVLSEQNMIIETNNKFSTYNNKLVEKFIKSHYKENLIYEAIDTKLNLLINQNKKIILYGAGTISKYITKKYQSIVFCLDKNKSLQDKSINSIKIISLDDIDQKINETMVILITVIGREEEIKKELLRKGIHIPIDNFVFYG